MYQGTKEALGIGIEKRDALVSRVQDARQTQIDAKDRLHRVLSSLRRIETVGPTEIDDLHGNLRDHVSETENKLGDLRKDTDEVRRAANELFEEWQADLARYESAALRERSQEQLSDARRNVIQLLGTLRRTAGELEAAIPVLRDQALFLEHQMNSGTAPGRPPQIDEVREQISTLIQRLQSSIETTQAFVDEGVGAA